jgi:hypothetical protein
MAEKKVQIKDQLGNLIYPKTRGEIVINNAGENLGGVEAGAQVNKIEKIKLNGVELSIVSKEVNVELPTAAAYSVEKLETAEEGMSATYQLTKDGVAVGAKINVPKDLVVKSGSVITKEGKKYIQLVIANDEETPIEVAVDDLVDVYTAGDETITISDNKISVNLETLKNTFAQVGDSYTKTEADGKFLTEHQDISGKQDKLSETQVAAINSGITAAKVTAYDGYATSKADASAVYTKEEVDTELAKKANTATTLAGYGITDAYTKAEIDGFNWLTYEELA